MKISIAVLITLLAMIEVSKTEDYCNKTRCSECEERRDHVVCTKCHQRFYHRFNYTCYNCPEGCLLCSDSDTCSKCDEENVLNSKKKCRKRFSKLVIILIVVGLALLLTVSGLVYCCSIKNIGGGNENPEGRPPGQRDANLPYVDPSSFRPIEIYGNPTTNF